MHMGERCQSPSTCRDRRLPSRSWTTERHLELYAEVQDYSEDHGQEKCICRSSRFPYRSRTRERHLGPYAEVDGNPEDNRQEKDISDYR